MTIRRCENVRFFWGASYGCKQGNKSNTKCHPFFCCIQWNRQQKMPWRKNVVMLLLFSLFVSLVFLVGKYGETEIHSNVWIKKTSEGDTKENLGGATLLFSLGSIVSSWCYLGQIWHTSTYSPCNPSKLRYILLCLCTPVSMGVSSVYAISTLKYEPVGFTFPGPTPLSWYAFVMGVMFSLLICTAVFGWVFFLCCWMSLQGSCCLGFNRRVLQDNQEREGLELLVNPTPLPHATFAIITNIHHRERENRCAICQIDFEHSSQLAIMPCSHYFHQTCVDSLVAASHNNENHPKCPICRQSAHVPFGGAEA